MTITSTRIAATLATTLTVAAVAQPEADWDKTFALSPKVVHEKVTYPNRYGIAISAHLYLPKDLDRTKKHAALVVALRCSRPPVLSAHPWENRQGNRTGRRSLRGGSPNRTKLRGR